MLLKVLPEVPLEGPSDLVDGLVECSEVELDTPELSQRFDAEVSAGRAEINGSWQKSVDGGTTWEQDFTVRYSRPGPP